MSSATNPRNDGPNGGADRGVDRLDLRRLRRAADFYFVRHGESEGNRVGKILGRLDLGLSDLGREHARAAGRFFAERLTVGSAAAYLASSPLSRCRETAELIAEEAGVAKPVIMDELIELDAGVFAGKSLIRIAEETPEAFGAFRVHSWEAVEAAERIASLYARAVTAWNHLIDAANGGAETLIAVTHAGFMQWILKAGFAGPEQQWMPVIKASNCGIFHCHVEATFFAEEGSVEQGTAGHESTVDQGAADENTADEGAAEHVSAEESVRAPGFFAEWRLMNHMPY